MRRAVAALVAVMAVVCGCGQKERQTVPVGDLVAAVDQTHAAPSQRIHMNMTMSAPALDKPVDFTGDGLIDNKTRKGRMTMDMSELTAFTGGTSSAGDGIAEQIIDGFTV